MSIEHGLLPCGQRRQVTMPPQSSIPSLRLKGPRSHFQAIKCRIFRFRLSIPWCHPDAHRINRETNLRRRALCLVGIRQAVSFDHCLAILYPDFDRLVDGIASFAEFIENDLQQFPLLGRRHLRDDDDETSVKRLLRIEPAKVRSIVGDEREIIADDAGHQVPIGLAAESEPVYVAGLMPARHRYRDERGMQTFINQQIHPAVSVPVGRGSRLSVVRLADFSLKPRSLSDFGRPRRGCAETHIVASASRRSSSLG